MEIIILTNLDFNITLFCLKMQEILKWSNGNTDGSGALCLKDHEIYQIVGFYIMQFTVCLSCLKKSVKIK